MSTLANTIPNAGTKKRRWSAPSVMGGAVLILVVMMFIIPQVYQQFILDQLPTTGDLIHRRIVYFLTNYPNIEDAPPLILGHSQLYHWLIADLNIVTGLTGEKAFYGLGMVNLLMLPLAVLSLYIFARRLKIPYPHIVPILFLFNPLLVGPFFGHANQHFIFIFVAQFLFVVLFFRPSLTSRIAALLLLGLVFNSSTVIWFPLAFILLLLDYWYPNYRLLLLASLALLLFLPFLHVPMGYLLLGDFAFTSFGKLAIALIIVSIGAAVAYRLWARRRRVHVVSLVVIAALVLGAFLFAREGTPFWKTLQPEELSLAKVGTESVNLIDYLFSVNPQKNIEGALMYVIITLLLTVVTVIVWFIPRVRASLPTQLRVIGWVVAIPVAIALLRLTLLSVDLDYYSRTPLYTLHVARLTSISFFLAPLLFVYFLFKLSSQAVGKRIVTFVMMAAVLNVALVSQFFFLRVYPDWTQKSYQKHLRTSIEQGIVGNLSGSEALYACKFYGYCSLQGQTDPGF